MLTSLSPAAGSFGAAVRARLIASIASAHFCWALYVSARPTRGVVDRVLGVALDQRGGDLRGPVKPARPQFRGDKRGSGNGRAHLAAEHLFQRGETLLSLACINLRDPDLCLDGWVSRTESSNLLELLQGGPRYRHFAELPMSRHRPGFCPRMV